MKMNHRELQRQLDRISASRLSKLNEGIPLHVALGQRHSITLRNKFARMGLKGHHVDACLKMVDEIGMQKVNKVLHNHLDRLPNQDHRS